MSGTNKELREALPGVPEIERTTMNSWEDPEFRAAVERTGPRSWPLQVYGLRSALSFRPSTHCARAIKCTSSQMPSVVLAGWRMNLPCNA